MSFILDALKKSEHERQRQAIPGLVESSIARPRQRLPVWAIALGALLGINLIVLLIVLARGWFGTPPARAPQVAAAAVTAVPLGAEPAGAATAPADEGTAGARIDDPEGHPKGWSPLDKAPADAGTVYAPEVPVAPVAAAIPAAGPPTPPTYRQPALQGDAAPHPGHRRDPLLNDGDYQAADEETLPSVSELNLSGPQALPELHLDVHVYATNPAERFVFINMRKYHEGATLQEGPTVERIRRDGVVLNYQGLRFLLPRQ
jgi:general secretion pathway protein B